MESRVRYTFTLATGILPEEIDDENSNKADERSIKLITSVPGNFLV